MDKFVVTGGAGLIGSWVIDHILKDKSFKVKEIVVMDTLIRGKTDNLKNALKSRKVRIVKEDIRDFNAVNKVIKGADYVIHEAVIKNKLCEENPRYCKEVLIDGTFNIFEACVKSGVKKLIFNSSASVYGEPEVLPMKENHPFNNNAFYGAAKIAEEELVKAFRNRYGLNYVGLRPFNAYGPRMDVSGVYTEVLMKWLQKLEAGEAPVIFGDGSQTFDFVYVEDIAIATIKALKSKRNEGFYNIGTGKETSLKKLLNLFLKAYGTTIKPVYVSGEGKLGFVSRRRADTSKARKELNFMAKTPLELGIKKLVQWYKETKHE
ncbi:NAD-dependent epimerase/dehydratase family protein [Candidatus Woesebacteria bacterium]|nr:NAD-dependent epimerase/dehydratase family protein [Candidatus Woesebacteria bacterium]